MVTTTNGAVYSPHTAPFEIVLPPAPSVTGRRVLCIYVLMYINEFKILMNVININIKLLYQLKGEL